MRSFKMKTSGTSMTNPSAQWLQTGWTSSSAFLLPLGRWPDHRGAGFGWPAIGHGPIRVPILQTTCGSCIQEKYVEESHFYLIFYDFHSLHDFEYQIMSHFFFFISTSNVHSEQSLTVVELIWVHRIVKRICVFTVSITTANYVVCILVDSTKNTSYYIVVPLNLKNMNILARCSRICLLHLYHVINRCAVN